MHAYITASTIAAATGTTTAVPTGIQTIYNGSVWVCVTPIGSKSTTTGTLTASSYTTTITGDSTPISVTLVTGTSAVLHYGSNSYVSGGATSVAFSVSGATTYAASDGDRVLNETAIQISGSKSMIFTGLTAGTNTFTLSYRMNTGTGTFTVRSFLVQGVA